MLAHCTHGSGALGTEVSTREAVSHVAAGRGRARAPRGRGGRLAGAPLRRQGEGGSEGSALRRLVPCGL